MRVEYTKPRVLEDPNYYKWGSTCAYCRGYLVEIPGDVYEVLNKFMCEDCYMGNTKPHCVTRPYKERTR